MDTTWHRRILKQKQIPGSKSGWKAELECGHTVMIFGDQRPLGGMALCLRCYENGQRKRRSWEPV